MKPQETASPTGDLRFRMLRKMLRTVIEHGLSLETTSSWALAIVGVGGGFIIANIEKLERHMSLCSRRWLFVLVLLSAFAGLVIKIFSALLQFDFMVEGKLSSYFRKQIKKLHPLNSIEDITTHLLNPVTEEFIASRPWVPRMTVRRILKRAESDVLYALKRGAYYAQWILCG
jgi:cell division septal protein FtsQ